MYTSENTMKKIVTSIPEFKDSWNEHLKYWEGDERTIGIDITAFCSFIIKKLKIKEDYNYRLVFDLIEELLVEGSEEVSYAIEFQFLENILNSSAHGHFPIESFFEYLGEKSKAFCKANEEFWGIENSKFYEDK
jgi:hypothetical protein